MLLPIAGLCSCAAAFLVIIFNSSINFCTHIKKDADREEVKRINTFRLIYVAVVGAWGRVARR